MIQKLYYSLLIIVLFSPPIVSQSNAAPKWENIQTATAPIARHENSFVAIGKNFYLIGGRGIKPISIYNIDSHTWTTGAAPETEIHHFQGVTYNNKVYVIGAMTGKYPYETPLATMLIYNPETNIWETGPEIPKERRRGSCGVVVDGDSVYMVSGIVDGHNSTHVPWVDRYDFKTGKWTVLADAPRARDHFQAAIGDGKIYAAGGRNSSFATKQTFELTVPEVDIYDIENDTWATLAKNKNIPTQRAGTTTVLFQNQLIVIGGESSGQQSAHDQVEVLHLKTMEWTPLPSLNRGRHGTQGVIYDEAIYIAAGSGNRGGKPELASLEKLLLKK
ncbi:Kelch repeat-containing protein [Maribacter chungangensis]|uniref:Kelch repeat-containing protein n=1 Tax=Maribacter chungangensis TaxID=1069117 RepID=A0ABW3B1P5_9FLAO